MMSEDPSAQRQRAPRVRPEEESGEREDDRPAELLDRLRTLKDENTALALANDTQREAYERCLDEDLREECIKLKIRVFDLERQNRALSDLFCQRLQSGSGSGSQTEVIRISDLPPHCQLTDPDKLITPVSSCLPHSESAECQLVSGGSPTFHSCLPNTPLGFSKGLTPIFKNEGHILEVLRKLKEANSMGVRLGPPDPRDRGCCSRCLEAGVGEARGPGADSPVSETPRAGEERASGREGSEDSGEPAMEPRTGGCPERGQAHSAGQPETAAAEEGGGSVRRARVEGPRDPEGPDRPLQESVGGRGFQGSSEVTGGASARVRDPTGLFSPRSKTPEPPEGRGHKARSPSPPPTSPSKLLRPFRPPLAGEERSPPSSGLPKLSPQPARSWSRLPCRSEPAAPLPLPRGERPDPRTPRTGRGKSGLSSPRLRRKTLTGPGRGGSRQGSHAAPPPGSEPPHHHRQPSNCCAPAPGAEALPASGPQRARERDRCPRSPRSLRKELGLSTSPVRKLPDKNLREYQSGKAKPAPSSQRQGGGDPSSGAERKEAAPRGAHGDPKPGPETAREPGDRGGQSVTIEPPLQDPLRNGGKLPSGHSKLPCKSPSKGGAAVPRSPSGLEGPSFPGRGVPPAEGPSPGHRAGAVADPGPAKPPTIEEKVMKGIEENMQKRQRQGPEPKHKASTAIASWFGLRKSKLPAISKKAEGPQEEEGEEEEEEEEEEEGEEEEKEAKGGPPGSGKDAGRERERVKSLPENCWKRMESGRVGVERSREARAREEMAVGHRGVGADSFMQQLLNRVDGKETSLTNGPSLGSESRVGHRRPECKETGHSLETQRNGMVSHQRLIDRSFHASTNHIISHLRSSEDIQQLEKIEDSAAKYDITSDESLAESLASHCFVGSSFQTRTLDSGIGTFPPPDTVGSQPAKSVPWARSGEEGEALASGRGRTRVAGEVTRKARTLEREVQCPAGGRRSEGKRPELDVLETVSPRSPRDLAGADAEAPRNYLPQFRAPQGKCWTFPDSRAMGVPMDSFLCVSEREGQIQPLYQHRATDTQKSARCPDDAAKGLCLTRLPHYPLGDLHTLKALEALEKRQDAVSELRQRKGQGENGLPEAILSSRRQAALDISESLGDSLYDSLSSWNSQG
ncbi:nck-associated protein 5-like isoform X2 [Heptranchias perlo]|uniref:nck-associated protein 5-like isoform X2 n=1 Tax=Heptranchias perlo TaxID=212740 RepID=UPI0035599EA5